MMDVNHDNYFRCACIMATMLLNRNLVFVGKNTSILTICLLSMSNYLFTDNYFNCAFEDFVHC
jgi:hypothetical protein